MKNYGYNKYENDDDVTFTNKYGQEIYINKENRVIASYDGTDFYKSYVCITLEELKAINEKVKELGWEE